MNALFAEEEKEDLALLIFTKAKKKVKVPPSQPSEDTATAAITTASVNLPRDNAAIPPLQA
ncbi:hypothetical protein D8674_031182 [Pyrus ussuriensis x Pyrus communis]|uniref:Uncharacterized protein n=1 Tax=Pyrus ussuriensis x Pyrus communis TaxID=2448454 RepID=A0A5N5F396_9ROSA|nr:hypothetical protein D8674_031172 [Pyrus ussuriensis x Pyrus communis]KAB2595732.1 hypothetical protein D8674_031182 [Pyrus ussuriensis x Pyrus communis]